MARPTLYHGNLLADGVLSGTNQAYTSPPERLADGFVGLPYVVDAVSGVSGHVEVLLATARSARYLALPHMRSLSGYAISVESVSGSSALGGSDASQATRYHGVFLVSGDGPQVHKLVSAGRIKGEALSEAPDGSDPFQPTRLWRVRVCRDVLLNSWEEWREFQSTANDPGTTGSKIRVSESSLDGGTHGSNVWSQLAANPATVVSPSGGWLLQSPLNMADVERFQFQFQFQLPSSSDAALVSGYFAVRRPGVGEYKWVLGKAGSGGNMLLPSGLANLTLVTVTLPVSSAAVSGASDFSPSEWELHVDQNMLVSLLLDHVRARLVSGTRKSGALYEAMLCSATPLPRDPQVGVVRGHVMRRLRLEQPGGASWTVRLGEEQRAVQYTMVTTRAETVSGVEEFLRASDDGRPFVFQDDMGSLYWAEVPATRVDFDDQAGVYTYAFAVREVPED